MKPKDRRALQARLTLERRDIKYTPPSVADAARSAKKPPSDSRKDIER